MFLFYDYPCLCVRTKGKAWKKQMLNNTWHLWWWQWPKNNTQWVFSIDCLQHVRALDTIKQFNKRLKLILLSNEKMDAPNIQFSAGCRIFASSKTMIHSAGHVTQVLHGGKGIKCSNGELWGSGWNVFLNPVQCICISFLNECICVQSFKMVCFETFTWVQFLSYNL